MRFRWRRSSVTQLSRCFMYREWLISQTALMSPGRTQRPCGSPDAGVRARFGIRAAVVARRRMRWSSTARPTAAASCFTGSGGRTVGRRALALDRGRTQRLPGRCDGWSAHQRTCLSHHPTAEAVGLPHRDQPSHARCRHLSTRLGHLGCLGLRQCDTGQITGAGIGDACVAIGQRGSRARRTLRRALVWAGAAGEVVGRVGGCCIGTRERHGTT